jgi:hypothetical protein
MAGADCFVVFRTCLPPIRLFYYSFFSRVKHYAPFPTKQTADILPGRLFISVEKPDKKKTWIFLLLLHKLPSTKSSTPHKGAKRMRACSDICFVSLTTDRERTPCPLFSYGQPTTCAKKHVGGTVRMQDFLKHFFFLPSTKSKSTSPAQCRLFTTCPKSLHNACAGSKNKKTKTRTRTEQVSGRRAAHFPPQQCQEADKLLRAQFIRLIILVCAGLLGDNLPTKARPSANCFLPPGACLTPLFRAAENMQPRVVKSNRSLGGENIVHPATPSAGGALAVALWAVVKFTPSGSYLKFKDKSRGLNLLMPGIALPTFQTKNEIMIKPLTHFSKCKGKIKCEGLFVRSRLVRIITPEVEK